MAIKSAYIYEKSSYILFLQGTLDWLRPYVNDVSRYVCKKEEEGRNGWKLVSEPGTRKIGSKPDVSRARKRVKRAAVRG